MRRVCLRGAARLSVPPFHIVRLAAALLVLAVPACTNVEERRRELCRQLCDAMRCAPNVEPAGPDDSCVQSCFNTSDPGVGKCLTYLDVIGRVEHHPHVRDVAPAREAPALVVARCARRSR